jgi:hypothetical protein
MLNLKVLIKSEPSQPYSGVKYHKKRNRTDNAGATFVIMIMYISFF